MGNKRDHTSVMDLLTSPYSDFVMDDREQEGCNSTRSLDIFGPGGKLGQCVCLPGPLLYYCHSPTREI